ncbi:MAG: polysaccharide deacetylase family protein [Chloroflexota bacterium]
MCLTTILIGTGIVSCTTNGNSPAPAEPESEIPLSSNSGALDAVDEDWLISQVTRAPSLLNLPTLTVIPTVTGEPKDEEVAANHPNPNRDGIKESDVTRFVRSTSTPEATATPLSVGLVPPLIEPQPTSALPDLPSRLPTPVLTYTVRVPILMYHYVSSPPEDANRYRVNLSVEPDDFRAQMAFIRDRGYQVVDLYTVIDALVNSEEPPEKSVVITFDDGYVDNYEIAYPILEEFGYKGTFFIVTEFVDFGYEGYMTWEMIEEMAAAGHRFESHTKSHPDLSKLSRGDLVWQILGSQETLAAHIGYKPQFLSYPSGRYNEETVTMAEELSLWGAVTTQGGMWRDYYNRYEWPRTRVSYTTTLRDLEKVFLSE